MTEWAIGTEGFELPLWRSISFRLRCEESMNNHHLMVYSRGTINHWAVHLKKIALACYSLPDNGKL